MPAPITLKTSQYSPAASTSSISQRIAPARNAASRIGHWTRNAANQRPWNLALLLTVGALVVIAIAMPVLRASLRWPLPNVYLLWPLLAAAVFLARRHPVSTRAVLSAGAVVVWLSAAERMEILNDHLEQQASVKPLAERLRLAPDLERATIFACEVRAHGWEF